MPRWQGEWKLNNIFVSEHGTKGKETVYAGNETDATEYIKYAASRKIFGTTAMQKYVQVSNLSKLKY